MRIIKIVAMTISLITFSYLVLSMFAVSFNIAKWSEGTRVFLAFASFMSLIISIANDDINKKK